MPLAQYTFSATLPHIESALRHLEEELDRACRKTAFKLQIEAVKVLQEKVYNRRRAKGEYIPTGALKASIFVETYLGQNEGRIPTHQMAAAAAREKARKGKKKITILPPPTKPKKGEAWVGVCVNYGVHVEYPTRGRPGVYYMASSVIKLRSYFMNEVARAVERAKNRG